MFPLEVLTAVAQGCGVSPERFAYRHSELLHSTVSAQLVTQQLRQTIGVGAEFDLNDNSLWGLKFLPAAAEVVSHCGNALIEAAIDSLPTHIQWYDTTEQCDKPRSLESILALWRCGSSGSRLEIGRAIAATFHPRKRADGVAVDYSKGADSYDQPSERVLPRCYGRWQLERGADNRPNCLGKFQLLAALGKRLGVTMLAVAPLEYGATLTNRYREQACRLVHRTCLELGIKLNTKRLESVLRVIQQNTINRSLPPLQHFAVLYRVDADCWMLVDPNSGLASYAAEPQQFEQAYQLLVANEAAAPGASLLFQDSEAETELCVLQEKTLQARQRILSIADSLHAAASWPQLRAVLIRVGVLGELLEADDALDIPGLLVEERADELLRRLWTRAYPDEVADFSATALPRIRETLVYKHLKAGESEMLTRYQSQVIFGKAFPPLYEVSLVPFRLAAATLSHVAFAQSTELGMATEETLYSFGVAEGHLYNVASGKWFSRVNDHVWRAERLLRLQSSHGQLARRIFSSERSTHEGHGASSG
jgi:hypothetical protein